MRLLKRTVSVVLSLIMIVSLFTIVPFTANATDAVEYLYRTWDARQNKVVAHTATCTDYTTITSTSSPLTLTSGWYVVNGDANITDHRVTISGKVYLILFSGTMNCEYGIRLSKGNSLYVYQGKDTYGTLNARTGSDEEANIGGNEGENCGEFEFQGGKLIAHNTDYCSGGTAIGGGNDADSTGSDCYISDEQFRMLAADYTEEQKELELRIPSLRKEIEDLKSECVNTQKFLDIVNKSVYVEELTPSVLRSFISKIVIHERDKKHSKTAMQRIDIYFRYIGQFAVPNDYNNTYNEEYTTENAKRTA